MTLQPSLKVQNRIGLLGILCIFLSVIFWSPNQFIYDEGYYQQNVHLLEYYGFSNAFIIHLNGPAGPTYALVHYLLYPISHGRPIPTRLINIGLLICSIYLLNKIFSDIKRPVLGWSLVFIPMTIVCTGMALTEMPALFLLICSVCFVRLFLDKKAIIYVLLAGLAYSFSILGRQPYLLLFPIFIFYIFYPFRVGSIFVMTVFSLASLLLPAYCFILWKGLIPTAGNIAEAGGLAYNHFFLACGYCMLAFIFVVPTFIVHPRKLGYKRLLGALIFSILVSFVFKFEYPIVKTIAERVIPKRWFPCYLNLAFSFLLFMSIYFLASCFYRFLESYNDKFLLFSFLSMIVLLISTIAITHQFSSRYIFQLSPFVIFIGAKYYKSDLYSNIFRVCGLVIGLFSLFSYYK